MKASKRNSYLEFFPFMVHLNEGDIPAVPPFVRTNRPEVISGQPAMNRVTWLVRIEESVSRHEVHGEYWSLERGGIT